VSQKKFLIAMLFLISSSTVTTAQTRAIDSGGAAMAAIARGNSAFASEDYEAAIREYGNVPANAGESYAQGLYNTGLSHYELWHTAEAIDFYRRAIAARHGCYPRASYALGVAFEDQGRLAEAREAYQQAIIESRGEYAAAHYRMGLLIAGQGEYKTAAESFRKALKHAGLHVPASHNNLGVMLARLGNLNDAQHEFEIALRQTGGRFDDAVHNLKLCRSLLTAAAPKQVAAFRVAAVIAGTN
jgi:tetratricopeptide (TPR) repeat protein